MTIFKKKSEKKKIVRGHVDYVVLFTTLALVAFGLLMLFSASFYYGLNRFGDGYYYVRKQLIGIVLGGIAMFFLARVDYHKWFRMWKLIYGIGLILMALVWIPGLGVRSNEATRWFVIPLIDVSVQPSELAKYAYVIAVAAFVSRHSKEQIQSFRSGVVPILLMFAPIAVMLLLQPNFSMLVILAVACFMMLVMSGVKMVQLGILGGAGIGLGALAMLAQGYRVDRITSLFDGGSYQLNQSLIAFGSGGVWGQGLGASRQKFLFLPYGESDMIFAVIAEELGLVGALLLVLTFALLYCRCFRIAMRCPDTGGAVLVGGCTALLSIQTIINMAVATGIAPTTGQTLPLISSGVTSIVVCMAVIGLILNVSRSCSQ